MTKQLMFKCTGELFKCDDKDWDKAKHCVWYYNPKTKGAVNEFGVTFETYVGIAGKRKKETEKLNYSRIYYD